MTNSTDYALKQINQYFKNASDEIWKFPPQKTREGMQNELEDKYSNILYDMTDEELEEEYSEKIQ